MLEMGFIVFVIAMTACNCVLVNLIPMSTSFLFDFPSTTLFLVYVKGHPAFQLLKLLLFLLGPDCWAKRSSI
jgi:hypothetical protein